MAKLASIVAGLTLCLAAPGIAQESAPPEQGLPEGWSLGPVTGSLGTRATLQVPAGYVFLDVPATRSLLERNQNVPSGHELGAVLRPIGEDYWFAIFTYSDTGHIDDSDRDDLDADGLLDSLKEDSKAGNEARRERGWPELTLVGWHTPPYYDTATNNLTWALRLQADTGPTVNHSVRLLGRTGVISAQLVADPSVMEGATAEFNTLLQGFSFTAGQKYAEFRKGDKLAGYGLAALVGAGAAGAAVKSGLLQKMWKGIVLGLLALVAAVKKFFRSLSGRSEEQQSA